MTQTDCWNSHCKPRHSFSEKRVKRAYEGRWAQEGATALSPLSPPQVRGTVQTLTPGQQDPEAIVEKRGEKGRGEDSWEGEAAVLKGEAGSQPSASSSLRGWGAGDRGGSGQAAQAWGQAC